MCYIELLHKKFLMKSTLSIFVTAGLLMLSENPFPNCEKKKKWYSNIKMLWED